MRVPLAQLHAELRACRRCLAAGYEITPGAIFGGNAEARVMLIGQAPGVTEAATGRPFNAGSGRRLFQWLSQAGWDEADFRQRHYMAAVTRCYPGRSSTGKGDRVPSKAEQALCRPFLEREIVLIKPRLLLLVGGLAIKLMYPANARLNDIIGTAVYFPPETLHNPLNFDLAQAEQAPAFDPARSRHGRWVVPLPHPSGASLWPNKLENQRLIAKAIQILHDIRVAWDL
jgi:uracil-DNA glycosylase